MTYVESEAPTALDVFEHAILSIPPGDFWGWDTFKWDVLYGEPWEIEISDLEQSPRCFIGQAIVRAPNLVGADLSEIRYARNNISFVSKAYGVSENLVENIWSGVMDMTFGEAVKYAVDAIEEYRNY